MNGRSETTETTDGDAPPASGDGRDWLPRLAVGTSALTFVLVLLGIWTAVAGYGLTCEGRWPLCDGAVFGLFPANFGSFVEWFHRLVAMIAGFAILGTAATTWLTGASWRIRTAFTAALVLTPFQVVLGGLTVTRYERLVLASHFGAALVILTLLVLGTIWVLDRPLPAVELGALGTGTVIAATVLTPGLVLSVHSVGLHVSYYALALTGFVSLFAVTVSPGDRHVGIRGIAGASALLVAVGMTIGRVRLDPSGQTLVAGALFLATILAVGTLWTSYSGLFGDRHVEPADPEP